MGSVIKTITYYEEAWWRDQGLSGVLIAGAESGPVYVSLDDTKPDGSYPALMGYVTLYIKHLYLFHRKIVFV